MPKPSTIPLWATSATGIANTTTPPAQQQLDGWAVAQPPPSQYFNWIQNLLGAWMQWLNDFENTIHTWTAQQTFSVLQLFNAGFTSSGPNTLNGSTTIPTITGPTAVTGGLTVTNTGNGTGLTT